MKLNDLYKQYRIYAGLTQKDVSDRSGVALPTIQKFENGSDIKVSTLRKLLKAAGINNSVDDLVPDVLDRPSYHFENAPARKRARRIRTDREFKWGDEK